MSFARAAGFVLPDYLVDMILLSEYLIHHHSDVVRRMPVQVNPDKSILSEKILHEQQPSGHIGDIEFEISLEHVIVCKMMNTLAFAVFVSDR